MKITLNTLNVNNKSVSKLILAFEYDKSVEKDKHVVSMSIDGTKYYIYVNDLTPAINAVIEHQAVNRQETFNEILQLEEPPLEDDEEECIEE